MGSHGNDFVNVPEVAAGARFGSLPPPFRILQIAATHLFNFHLARPARLALVVGQRHHYRGFINGSE